MLFTYHIGMKRVFNRLSYFGLLGVLLVVVFGISHDHAYATPTRISTVNSFDAWGWIGMPVDQAGGTAGTSTESVPGYIHLNCDSWAGCTGSHPNVQVELDSSDPDYGKISGWAWMGTTDTVSNPSIGWLDFDPQPLSSSTYTDGTCTDPSAYFPTAPCYTARVDTSNQVEVSGWARFSTLACHGDQVLFNAATCDGDYDNDWGWVLLAGTITTGDIFEVNYRDGTFEGWAYSGGGTLPDGSYSNAIGFGWIDFSNASTGATTGRTDAYLSTEQGDVYAYGGVENPALTPSQYGSTYLILTDGTLSEFTSESGYEYTDFGEVTLPDAAEGYRNAIGRFELDKLTTTVDGNENVYGDEVDTSVVASDFNGDFFLDGRVIYINTDVTVSNSTTFTNGTSSSPSSTSYNGSGVVVVNGNLTLDASTYYGHTELFDIKNLASVAWIVLGDLTVSADVSNLVGSYFVLGDVTGTYPGTFTTEPASNSQLVMYGLVMARSFDLQRTYFGLYGTDEPAELIYYDGRIIANTPPGLKDFTSTLPQFSGDE